MDREAAISEAILRFTPEQFTADGKPSVEGINQKLGALDHEPVTAAERDALWAEREAEAATAGVLNAAAVTEKTPDHVTLRLDSAMAEPLPLYVHGAGRWDLVVGQTYTLPAEAVAALRDSDAAFTIIED